MRTLIAAPQIAAGSLVLVTGVLQVLQAWVNLTWEVGFYGEPSPIAVAVLLQALIFVSLGTLASLLGWGYAQGRLSGQWILFGSLFLMCVVPESIAWPLLAASMLVVWERYRSIRRQQGS